MVALMLAAGCGSKPGSEGHNRMALGPLPAEIVGEKIEAQPIGSTVVGMRVADFNALCVLGSLRERHDQAMVGAIRDASNGKTGAFVAIEEYSSPTDKAPLLWLEIQMLGGNLPRSSVCGTDSIRWRATLAATMVVAIASRGEGVFEVYGGTGIEGQRDRLEHATDKQARERALTLARKAFPGKVDVTSAPNSWVDAFRATR